LHQAKYCYQIKVKGILDNKWSNWFDDLKITPLANGHSLLSGSLEDQSALFGLLERIHNLGLLFVSLDVDQYSA
jgi:hypothetical protein